MTLRGLLAFLHLLGIALWVGGAAAAMAAGMAARREAPAAQAAIFRTLARIHVRVIAPGALLVVGSGLALVAMFVQRGLGARLGATALSVMMGAGLLAGILVLFIALPAAQKMAGLAVADDDGNLPPALHRFRARLAAVSSVAGVLALLALYAGVVGV